MPLEIVLATVVEVIEFNPTLRAIRFMPDTGGLARYAPGDYLFVRVPAADENSPSAIRSLNSMPQVRAYSLSSSPTRDFYEVVVVEKPIEPHVSKLLQYIDRGGLKLEISAPKWVYRGRLFLPGSDWQKQKLLFIAGGRGLLRLLAPCGTLPPETFPQMHGS